MTMEIISVLLFALLLAAGFAGCVLPYPGHAFILGGCALFSAMQGQYPAWYIWVILGALGTAGFLVDNVCAMLGAKTFGGGKAAVWGTLIGVILGAGFFPVGLIIGAFFGAFFGELLFAGTSLFRSAGAGLGAVLGYIAGVIGKLILALLMLAVYAYALWGGLV